MKAKAAVFLGAQRDFEVREFDVCETPSGYGRCELIASGVCGTDVHIRRGRLAERVPTIIGHEFVGRLVDCDEAEATRYGLSIGDRVIADIAMPCGECELCRRGDEANCVRMGLTVDPPITEPPHLFGGYTEVNFTPLSNLIRIPDSVDAVAAAVFACPGPTAMHAFELSRRANAPIDAEHVKCAVVQGLGPVGAYAVMYLRSLGVEKVYSILRSENESRIAAASSLGADEVLVIERDGEEAIIERLSGENGGIGVDLVFEASGAPGALPLGIAVLRNRGVYLIPGQYSESGEIAIRPQDITFKALQIFGSSQYDFSDVRSYLGFLEAHTELTPTIRSLATTYTIDEVNEAFAAHGEHIKTLLVK